MPKDSPHSELLCDILKYDSFEGVDLIVSHPEPKGKDHLMLGFRECLILSLTSPGGHFSSRVMPQREANRGREVSFYTYIQFNTHKLLQKSVTAPN